MNQSYQAFVVSKSIAKYGFYHMRKNGKYHVRSIEFSNMTGQGKSLDGAIDHLQENLKTKLSF